MGHYDFISQQAFLALFPDNCANFSHFFQHAGCDLLRLPRASSGEKRDGERNHSEPISASRGLGDAMVLKDGDGFAQVAGLGWAAA
ncbi:hypothetical protein, partial [Nonomuraea sp. NPDC003201]